MSKMFVHYKGTVDAFKAAGLESTYTNHIVFIKGGADGRGAAIYTHGNYYADLNEAAASLNAALSNLTYISSVKAGGVIASATGPNGTIEFTAADPTTVAVSADSTGVAIGLTDAFKKQVTDNKTAIEAEVTNRGTAISQAKQELTEAINGKADATVVSGINGRVAAIEGDYLKAADIAGKLDASVYAEKVAALEKADTDNLDAAKAYVDAEILKLDAAAQAAQVEANKQAIALLNGTDTGKSAREIVQDEVAKQLEAEGISESFDTLTEMATWLSSHPADVTEINRRLTSLEGLMSATSVADQIAAALVALKTELTVADTAVAGQYVASVKQTNGKIEVTRAALPVDTLVTGSENGTVSFNGTDVAVKGLGSAAFTPITNYATSEQGAKADAAAPQATTYTKVEVDAMLAWEELD